MLEATATGRHVRLGRRPQRHPHRRRERGREPVHVGLDEVAAEPVEVLERRERVPIVAGGPVREDRAGPEHLDRKAEVALHRRERRLEPFRDAAGERMGALEPRDARGRAWAAPARIGSGSGSAVGSPGTGPASSDSSSRTSAIDVASGPNVDRSIQRGMGSRPITPFVGLRPASPQNAAGIRIEPPPSVAVAIAAMPAASAAPEPPLEPPGDQSVPHGFVVVAVQRVRREPRERELRLVRLADDDRAGGAQPARHEPVGRRRRRRPRTSANRTSTAYPVDVLHVLHEQGQTGERTRVLARGDPGVDRAGRRRPPRRARGSRR